MIEAGTSIRFAFTNLYNPSLFVDQPLLPAGFIILL